MPLTMTFFHMILNTLVLVGHHYLVCLSQQSLTPSDIYSRRSCLRFQDRWTHSTPGLSQIDCLWILSRGPTRYSFESQIIRLIQVSFSRNRLERVTVASGSDWRINQSLSGNQSLSECPAENSIKKWDTAFQWYLWHNRWIAPCFACWLIQPLVVPPRLNTILLSWITSEWFKLISSFPLIAHTQPIFR